MSPLSIFLISLGFILYLVAFVIAYRRSAELRNATQAKGVILHVDAIKIQHKLFYRPTVSFVANNGTKYEVVSPDIFEETLQPGMQLLIFYYTDSLPSVVGVRTFMQVYGRSFFTLLVATIFTLSGFMLIIN